MKSWFTITAAAQGSDTAHIAILDEIGFWGVTARQFIDAFKAIEAPKVVLSINSPGGSVIDALAIFNTLVASDKHVTIKVLGIAASAASYLMLAGDHVQMPANTFAMLHSPLAGAYGHADDLREVADVLDKVGASLHATYMKRTGKTEAEITDLLSKDTWLTAQECLDLGLCDEVLPELKISASFDPENLPEHIKAALKPAAKVEDEPVADPVVEDEPVADPVVEPAARIGAEKVKALAIAAGLTEHAAVFALDATLDTSTAVEAALRDALEVVALCAVAERPAKASEFITARTPLAQVRTQLIEARAAADQHIDTTPKGKGSAAKPAKPGAVSTASVWASRHKATAV